LIATRDPRTILFVVIVSGQPPGSAVY